MGVLDWCSESLSRIARDGTDGLRESLLELHVGAARRLPWDADPGVPIYDHEWDVLVVLDGCRYDLFTTVADEYEFIESSTATRSVASLSAEWMQRNFGERYAPEVAETVYVNGNPGTANNIDDPGRFRVLDDVWQYAWDDDLGTIHPEPLTDRAIALHRELDPERMIVHYMQPHYPFVPEPFPIAEGRDGRSVWDLLREGAVTRDEVWRRYRDNLRYVLDRLPTLLSNLAADRVVLTADHGNLVGEWGLYGHYGKVAHPKLRTVPWAPVTAADRESYTPELEPDETCDPAVVDRLHDLGYV